MSATVCRARGLVPFTYHERQATQLLRRHEPEDHRDRWLRRDWDTDYGKRLLIQSETASTRSEASVLVAVIE